MEGSSKDVSRLATRSQLFSSFNSTLSRSDEVSFFPPFTMEKSVDGLSTKFNYSLLELEPMRSGYSFMAQHYDYAQEISTSHLEQCFWNRTTRSSSCVDGRFRSRQNYLVEHVVASKFNGKFFEKHNHN